MPERTISHYRVGERLGAGGMAVVYKAVDLDLGRPVALKFLPEALSDDPEGKRRLLREARAAAALDHPHICTVHEIGETEDGELFIAMAFYPGMTLAERLRREEMPIDEILVLGVQLAEALAHAHAHGIVHRDVKPGNVLVTRDGQAKLLDFGLALLEAALRVTPTGEAAGTLKYMSPEQILGGSVDERSDVWSLGALLYEALAGRPPFGGTPADQLRDIVGRDPVPIGELRSAVSPDVDGAVRACLSKRPEERPQSAAELAATLRGLREAVAAPTRVERLPRAASPDAPGRPTAPVEPSAGGADHRLGPRRKLGLAAALAGVAFVAALAVALWLGRPPSASGLSVGTIAVLPFANLTGRPDQDYLGDGLAAALLSDLDEVEGLQTIGRSEAWTHRGRSPTEVGRLLGADAVVEGELQQERDRLRVAVRLTDARDGRVQWSSTFDGTHEAIFALQHRIATHLAEVLTTRLSRSERSRLLRDPTESVDAYDAYLQGRRALDEAPSPEAAREAVEHLRRAVRLDPEFALARVALSEALWRIGRQLHDPRAAREAGQEARRALELAPDLPAAQVAIARVLRGSGHASDSIETLHRSLARHPRPAEAHRELGVSYESVGDAAEAERQFRAATALDPDDWVNWNALASFLTRNGRTEAARTAYERAARLAPPGVRWPQENLAMLEILDADFEAAIAAFEGLDAATADPEVASNMGTAYFFAGRLDEAEALYRRAVELQPREPALHRNLGDLQLRRGREEAARRSYRRAIGLTEDELARQPGSADLRVQRALLAAKAGECERATDGLPALWQEVRSSALLAHDVAVAWAVCDRRDAALEAVAGAVAAGVSPDLIRAEDEFRSLAGDPRFERALNAGP